MRVGGMMFVVVAVVDGAGDGGASGVGMVGVYCESKLTATRRRRCRSILP
jgi:hypothetical protein